MKNVIVLLVLLVSIQSCNQRILTGKEHVRIQQAQGNYDLDKWAREYKKLNSSKAKAKPSVTTDMPKRSTLSPWM